MMMPASSLELLDFKEPLAYAEALRAQTERQNQLLEGRRGEALFLLEHEEVLTLGKHQDTQHLLVEPSELARLGLALVKSSRGGDITYHGPGQLVVYPLLRLQGKECDVRAYVHNLEEIVLRTASDFGIHASRKPTLPGVWVKEQKLAAIGVRLVRWITSHGLALNIHPNLERFKLIHPCGLREYGVTSFKEILGAKTPTLEEVKACLLAHFATVLNRKIFKRPTQPLRRPPWLRVKIQESPNFKEVSKLLSNLKLHTVCKSAACPNIFECFGEHKTATIMILGNFCTRTCKYCNVQKKRQPPPPDPEEPAHVLSAVQQLGLKHVVLTSVTRDDLPDFGAGHFAETIQLIKQALPSCRVEVLIPDFANALEPLTRVLTSQPDILGHNLETVSRIFQEIRPKTSYAGSLALLQRADLFRKQQGTKKMLTKSGLMVGLGESLDEILQTMDELRAVNCDVLTIGQYLNPSRKHTPVVKFYELSEFQALKQMGLEKGFKYVESGPLVRSSYLAHKQVSEP